MPKTRDDDFNAALGERLKQARECAGFSQAELAARLDVSYQQVQKYESGATRLTVEKLCDYARVCNITFAQLLPTVMIDARGVYHGTR